jgi:glutathione S-transferase
MFASWNRLAPKLMGEDFEKEWESEMPACYAWHKRLQERESVKKVYAFLDKVVAEQGH